MKCLIADDDRMARLALKRLCDQHGELEVVGECEDGVQTINFLRNQSVDLIFLDIHMPDMTGMDLVRNLDYLPQVIFTTGDLDFAAEAFEHNVTDYLVKPVEYVRFLKAVDRAKKRHEDKMAIQAPGKEANEIFLKVDGKLVNVSLDDILYIESDQDYVLFYTPNKKYLVYGTIKSLEEKLPAHRFQKVHRKYIVQISKISDIQDNMILIHEKIIPISRSNREALMGKLNTL